MKNYDEQFNLRKKHPFARIHLLHSEIESWVTRLKLKSSLDIPYGISEGEKIDIFPSSKENSPVFIFIHGGYFKALDKRQYSYIANPFTSSSCTTVIINYDLVPHVSIKDIIQQSIKAYLWIYNNISKWNGNPNNMILCGHSVGAFLVSKILEFDWNLPIKNSISSAIFLSGIYDLSTVKKSYLNDILNISMDDVINLSPINSSSLKELPSVIVAVGEDETEEFILQSKNYFNKIEMKSISPELILLKNKNHYTVARLLSNKDNILIKKIFELLK